MVHFENWKIRSRSDYWLNDFSFFFCLCPASSSPTPSRRNWCLATGHFPCLDASRLVRARPMTQLNRHLWIYIENTSFCRIDGSGGPHMPIHPTANLGTSSTGELRLLGNWTIVSYDFQSSFIFNLKINNRKLRLFRICNFLRFFSKLSQ